MIERKVITVTPNAATFATPYSSGDVVGVLLTIANAVLEVHGAALLESLTVLDKSAQGKALDLAFFDEVPVSSIGADNAAYALADADLAKCIGRVSVVGGDYATASTNNVEGTKINIGLVLQAKPGKKDLYVAVIARAGLTLGTAADLSIKLGLNQG